MWLCAGHRTKIMKIISPNFKEVPDPDKNKVLLFLATNLEQSAISFDQLRVHMNLEISDKRLHRICIDAGYGVIK